MVEAAVRVRIVGRVQGVFFRAGCAQRAAELGATGWVANDPDGSVSARFEGPAQAVVALVEWCRTGSPRARVEGVEVTETDPTGCTGFDIR